MGIRRRSGEGDTGADAALLSAPARGVALSVDLACADYRDIGVALVTYAEGHLAVRVFDVPLTGRPAVQPLATWLRALSEEHDVTCLCIDGPLGWKAPDTDSLHSRLSERAVRAPGKTGLPPDGVKPRSYLAFTTFSIAIFEALRVGGAWALPGEPHAAADAGTITESFPTAAWRALGLAPLMAKGRASARDVQDAAQRLATCAELGLRGLESVHTHDQLQAVVGGIAGAWWAAGEKSRVHLAGASPFLLDGSWREGYIMIPASSA